MKKTTFKIEGMHCTSCAMNIDGELEDTEGVKKSNTNYGKQNTEVEYDEEKIDENKIMEIIKNAGYSANIV
jgi:Cu+-exporting ATPase